jgi:hypothetical protein
MQGNFVVTGCLQAADGRDTAVVPATRSRQYKEQEAVLTIQFPHGYFRHGSHFCTNEDQSKHYIPQTGHEMDFSKLFI